MLIKNVYAPDEDPNLTIEHYVRDYDQNEMLGLNDMNTENYLNTVEEKEKVEAEEVGEAKE